MLLVSVGISSVKRKRFLFTLLIPTLTSSTNLTSSLVYVVMSVHGERAQTNRQTDQTTTLCVQEVEIYLERWEVLGALVVVDVG